MGVILRPGQFNSQPQYPVQLGDAFKHFSTANSASSINLITDINSPGVSVASNDVGYATRGKWSANYLLNSNSYYAVGPRGRYFVRNNTNIAVICYSTPVVSFLQAVTNKFTLFVYLNLTGCTGSGTTVSVLDSTVSSSFSVQIPAYNIAAKTITIRAIWAGHWTGAADAVFTNVDFSNPMLPLVVVYEGSTKTVYLGENKATFTGVGFTKPTSGTLNIWGGIGTVGGGNYLELFTPLALEEKQVRSLQATPWQIYKAPSRNIFVSVAGGAALSATLSNNASIAAALTILIAPAATISAASTLNAGLTITTPLAASIDNQSGISAGLAIATPLAASISNQSGISAGLAIATPLASTASNQATSAANLTGIAPGVLAAITSNAAASATALQISTPLSAVVASQSAVSATLTGVAAGDMAASATNAASAIAGLSIGTALAANTPSLSTASGLLQLQIALSAQTVNQAVASANLTGVVPGAGVYPSAATVLSGITYGPTGTEFTGTLAMPTAADIALAMRTEITPELTQLTKISKIHGIGVPLVVTPTSRTAGSVSQTINTVGDTTTVSAA